MSTATIERAAQALQATATDIAWNQWRSIGGSAASKSRWQSIVDPEALILASLFLADREPRISDVMFSWVESNADILSVQRLKNLQKLYPAQARERVAGFANRTRSLAKHPRWGSLGSHGADGADGDFPSLPDVRRAVQAQTRSPASLVIRLRLAFGVGIKADILAVIIGNTRPTTIREIADNLAYTPVGVRSAVYDLVRAGFIIPAGGKPSAFAAPPREWRTLLRLRRRPIWVPWHHWFALTTECLAWVEGTKKKKVSDYAMDVRIRELAARHELFFRYAAHELPLDARGGEMGSSTDLLESLVPWAQHQERRAAV